MENNRKQQTYKSLYLSPIVAGSMAGVAVVTAIYPLDTLKTRLQAAQGFNKAGGFKGVYKGLPVLAVSSVPINCAFFLSYETIKSYFEPLVTPQYVPAMHMFAASFSELLTCLIKVPTEVVKQRKQTHGAGKNRSAVAILSDAYRKEGIRRGVYRGFLSTVLRDLPFSLIELPTWELLKTVLKNENDGQVTSYQSALCGSVAGGLAAIVTMPLDLAKTRIMLAESTSVSDGHAQSLRITAVLAHVYGDSGLRGLFAGLTPRITLVMLGGFLFFGIYEETRKCFEEYIGER